MQIAIRHLADDVRERFTRLRMRNHTVGDHPAAKAKRRSTMTTQTSAGNNVSADSGSGDRTETPDLIRPHVDTESRTASLPPLPPTPATTTDRPRRRRRSSTYLYPSSSVAVMGHIYEEIPPTPLPQQRRDSTSSCASAEVGRVYYVSPLDGALCRIFPVDERAVNRRQLACTHVSHETSSPNDERSSSPPIDVISVAASGLSAVRGRELRLCTSCYRHLRSSLATDENATRDTRRRSGGTLSPSFYNSCDLGLLNVPCCYSSEADDDEISRRAALHTIDTDTTAARDSVCDDVISDVMADNISRVALTRKLKFGEAGSAFTKFDGGRRVHPDKERLKGSTSSDCDEDSYVEDGRRRQRPCRVVTDPSFDERRRPLRNADNALLAILDSTAPDTDCRSHYLYPRDDFRRAVVDGVNCAKSTSCVDVRSARRRSLVMCRRSDDDGRRRRSYRSSRPTANSCRQSAACCSGSEPALQRGSGVKSVYYNGLLSSMIDLTAVVDKASAEDRLSCRATSGPRRSLRRSRQLALSSDRCPADQHCTSAIHHSSGDLMLRCVQ